MNCRENILMKKVWPDQAPSLVQETRGLFSGKYFLGREEKINKKGEMNTTPTPFLINFSSL